MGVGLDTGSLALLVVVVRQSPEGQAVVDRVLPAARPARHWRLPVPRAPAGPLTVVFVDPEGQRVPGVHVRLARCDVGVWEVHETDAAGEVAVPGGSCLNLDIQDDDWSLAGPVGLHAGAGDSTQTALLVRRCAGPVEVTLDGQPATGWLYLRPGGRVALDAAGRAELPDRQCSPAHLVLTGPDRRAIPLRTDTIEVDGPGLQSLDLQRAPPHNGVSDRTVTVRLDCTDCPDQLVAPFRRRCTGADKDWTCTCPTDEACALDGWWQEAVFDWRFVKEEVARVPPDVDQVDVPLPESVAEVDGRWSGALPCAVQATNPQTGAVLSDDCDPDGRFALTLRKGTWQVLVGWSPDAWDRDLGVQQAGRSVTLDGHDVDLGDVGPE